MCVALVAKPANTRAGQAVEAAKQRKQDDSSRSSCGCCVCGKTCTRYEAVAVPLATVDFLYDLSARPHLEAQLRGRARSRMQARESPGGRETPIR